MGVGSVSIGTDTNQGFAGIGAVGFPPISGGNNKFYAYNPATQSWSTKAALPQPYRYQSLVFATSGKLYVLGGYNYYIDKIGPPIHYKAAYYKDFWQYDIGSDKWTKKNDLPIDSADFNKCVAMNIGEKGFLLLNNNMWEYAMTSGIQTRLTICHIHLEWARICTLWQLRNDFRVSKRLCSC
jgi:hypothetical protein